MLGHLQSTLNHLKAVVCCRRQLILLLKLAAKFAYLFLPHLLLLSNKSQKLNYIQTKEMIALKSEIQKTLYRSFEPEVLLIVDEEPYCCQPQVGDFSQFINYFLAGRFLLLCLFGHLLMQRGGQSSVLCGMAMLGTTLGESFFVASQKSVSISYQDAAQVINDKFLQKPKVVVRLVLKLALTPTKHTHQLVLLTLFVQLLFVAARYHKWRRFPERPFEQLAQFFRKSLPDNLLYGKPVDAGGPELQVNVFFEFPEFRSGKGVSFGDDRDDVSDIFDGFHDLPVVIGDPGPREKEYAAVHPLVSHLDFHLMAVLPLLYRIEMTPVLPPDKVIYFFNVLRQLILSIPRHVYQVYLVLCIVALGLVAFSGHLLRSLSDHRHILILFVDKAIHKGRLSDSALPQQQNIQIYFFQAGLFMSLFALRGIIPYVVLLIDCVLLIAPYEMVFEGI